MATNTGPSESNAEYAQGEIIPNAAFTDPASVVGLWPGVPVVMSGRLIVERLTEEDVIVEEDEFWNSVEVMFERSVVDVPLISVVIVLSGLGS